MPFVGIGRRNLVCFIREFVLNFLYNQFDKRHLKKPLPMESWTYETADHKELKIPSWESYELSQSETMSQGKTNTEW